MGYQLLEEPICELVIARTKNQYVSGVVAVPLSKIIDNDLEGLLDIFEGLLVGNHVLVDVEYCVVGTGLTDEIHFKVSAFVEIIS